MNWLSFIASLNKLSITYGVLLYLSNSFEKLYWKSVGFNDPNHPNKGPTRGYWILISREFDWESLEKLYHDVIDLPGGCWIPISWEESYFCIIKSTQNFFPDITRSFHIFPVYRIEKNKKFSVPRMYLIPFPEILKSTFPITRQKSGRSRVPKKPC